MQMVPGLSNMPQLQGNEGNAKLKAYINIMDSMTDKGAFIYRIFLLNVRSYT